LAHICRFLGINDVFHISASGSKGTPEQVIAQAKQQVDELVSSLSSHQISGVV
jgi:FMN-dependent NADH-azoreductase